MCMNMKQHISIRRMRWYAQQYILESTALLAADANDVVVDGTRHASDTPAVWFFLVLSCRLCYSSLCDYKIIQDLVICTV